MTLEQEIKDKARALGFDAVGITDAAPLEATHVARLQTWLDSGCAGAMHYMRRNFAKRIDPRALLDGAASVIVAALSYKPEVAAAAAPGPQTPPLATVAQYAQYDDYHTFMRPLLHELADFIRSATDGDACFKACVDSVPLAERALAVRAGLGFIGRNHMLIHPKLGPQVFLGELVTTVPLDPDEPTPASCADCRRCLDACPTGALRSDGQLDAGRCISYLTIEHKGEIPPDLAARIGDRIFGCDECVRACPYTQAAPTRTNERLRHHPERARLNLCEVLKLTEDIFARRFADSPIARTGLNGLQRNARVCLRNANVGGA